MKDVIIYNIYIIHTHTVIFQVKIVYLVVPILKGYSVTACIC